MFVFVFVLCSRVSQVQAKESMLTILAVCMFGTSSILESMAATLDTQVGGVLVPRKVVRRCG